MFVRGKRHFLLLTLVLLLTMASLAGCGATEEPITEPTTEPPIETPVEAPTEPPPEPTEPAIPCEYPTSVGEQFIVTGPADEVWFAKEAVKALISGSEAAAKWQMTMLDGLQAQEQACIADELAQAIGDGVASYVSLETKGQTALDFLPGLLGSCEELAPLASLESVTPVLDQWGLESPEDGWEMHLVEISLSEGIPDNARSLLESQSLASLAVSTVNLLANSCNYPLSADVVLGATALMGGPWTAMGSPWTDSPVLAMPGKTDRSQEELMDQQWALGSTVDGGIGLYRDGNRPDYRGEHVWIGIFDTSPLHGQSEVVVDWLQLGQSPQPSEDYTWRPVVPGVNWATVPCLEETWKGQWQNHGLFVAGLAHVVAPDSEIHLYRVLNDKCEGDLYTLNAALATFIESYVQATSDAQAGIRGGVINLSLGHATTIPFYSEILGYMEAAGEQPSPDIVEAIKGLEYGGPSSLSILLDAARCLDIVIVSAAGNDMDTVLSPAALSSTLGIAASDSGGALACYSSPWGPTAPGGNGVGKDCGEPDFSDCPDDGSTECSMLGLLSLVVEGEDTALAYGAGTSFSTPLVSGIAALLLQEYGGPESADWLSLDGHIADLVVEEIEELAAVSDPEHVVSVPYHLWSQP